MNELSKIILALIIITGTFIILDFSFGQIADKVIAEGSSSKPAYDLKRKADDDLIVVGSSRAIHHYDTQYFTDSLGIPSYNLGMDSKGLTYYAAILSEYLEKNNPKIIVLDLIPKDFDGTLNSRITALYPFMKKDSHIAEIAKEVEKYGNIALYSNLYRYNGAMPWEIKYRFKKYNPDRRGFVPLFPKKMIGMEKIDYDIPEEVDSIAFNSFKTIANAAKEKNIKLIAVISPIYFNLSGMSNIKNVITQFENVHFIDDSNIYFDHPEEVYNDNSHLNQKGAEIFTKIICEQLDSICHI